MGRKVRQDEREVRTVLTFLTGLAALFLGLAGGVTPLEAAEGPDRILVAPVSARSSLHENPEISAAPELLAEVLEGNGPRSAGTVHHLSSATLEALKMDPGDPPTARALVREKSLNTFKRSDRIRILVLPSVASSKVDGVAGYRIELRWIDLVSRDEGTTSGTAPAGAPSLELMGDLALQARTAWRPGWREGGPALERSSPSRILSGSPEAMAAWGEARRSWSSAAVPDAARGFESALQLDPGFGRAMVDLAWIRLAQGRREEAGRMASTAVEGGRLTSTALEEATLVRLAATGDAQSVLSLAETLEGRGGESFRGSLAAGLGNILDGTFPRAISPLDEARRYRPHDPALVHLAGVAGLGAEDYYEATSQLERAALLWPENETILTDLAEAHVRNRDLEAASNAMSAWVTGWSPGVAPAGSSQWTVENPPPPVRAVSILLLQGRLSEAIGRLSESSTALAQAGAEWTVQVPVLHALHELQRAASALGSDQEKQVALDGARESLKQIYRLVPDEERQARPWLYERLQAMLRVREGRLDEALEIRETITAASELDGYDPGVEAEIAAAITLKEADTVGHFAACRRGVEARGLLEDHARLAQAYAVAGDWKGVDEEFATMNSRLSQWSPLRRPDGLTSSLTGSAFVPFIYYMGALARMNQGDVPGSRERFATFLAYFKRPDTRFRSFRADATSRGAKPAW